MKIVITQFYTKNVSYGEYAEKINSEYCKKHGYTYYVEKDSTKIRESIQDRHPTWYKPKLITEVIEKENPDWIFFLDIDAIVCDFDRKVEEFIDNDYKIIASDDIGHHSDFNAGVLLVKNTPEVVKFLDRWFNSGAVFTGNDAKPLDIRTLNETHDNIVGLFKQALWHDQTCLTLLSRLDEYKGYFKTLDRNIFNHGEFGKKNFIFHAYTKGHHPYRTLDIAYRTLFPEDYSKLETKNIVVYHIFCTGNYLEVVNQQLSRLSESGLYDFADIIHITCTNPDGDFDEIDKIFNNYPKLEVSKFTRNAYEYDAITTAWEYAQKYNGNILYFHAKGVSNRYVDISSGVESERKVLGTGIWKDLMEYYLIDHYQDCLERLTKVDQVGLTNSNHWWWGNFWWSTLESLRLQTKPRVGDRWGAEAWINEGRITSKYEYYHFTWNPYYTTLPVEFYTQGINSPVEILKAEYGTIGIQQDEGRRPTERLMVDVTDIVLDNFKANNNEKLLLRVDNQTFKGDPNYGFEKELELTLKIEDKIYYVVVAENQNLDISLK